MRIHLLAPPNVQTTQEYALDNFGVMTCRFAKMLKGLGHEVTLYASEENEAPCAELVTLFSKAEQIRLLGITPFFAARPAANHPLWMVANVAAIKEIRARKQPRDLICSIGGLSQKPIADAFPELFFVEYSIGYHGTFSKYRVYESSAWRHFIHGEQKNLYGRYFDDVIPAFFDEEEYPFQQKKEPYVAYLGRLTSDKGVNVACLAAKEAGVKLYVSGYGDKSLVTHGAEYLGVLSDKDKKTFLGKASAVLCPTQYLEPFGCVAVEAQLCGTPVISTDFGGFVETVEEGITGNRCRYLGEFIRAIRERQLFDPERIRARAIAQFSIKKVAPRYQRYFDRLELLWGKGWNSQ